MKYYSQKGQTLVETVVGIFLLTVGVSTALGLAVSIFNASSSAVKQVIATGLAREGAEAVFNMRATNWLKGAVNTDCFNYVSSPSTTDATCHRDWTNPGISGTYDIRGTGGKCYTIDFNPTTPATYWTMSAQVNCTNNVFRLNYDSAITKGLYTTANVGTASDYYRQIYIEEQTDSTSPSVSYYQSSIGPRLKVASRVWWTDRGCPAATAWTQTVPKCRIELVTYLTNWRNY
jgi:hypothetical protein